MNDSYCPLPWIGLNILPGYVAPCCQWHGQGVNTDNIVKIEFANQSELFDKTRKAMLANETVEGCQQCKLAEAAGVSSRRLEAIAEYGCPTEIKTELLDISFDNICNLKCRGCASASSHLWYADEKELYGKTFIDKKYIDHDIDIDVDNLSFINISGGEPFLSKKFIKFVEKIKSKNILDNLFLSISTNGTVLPPQEVYEILLKSNRTAISISIDGIGKLNEFFRSGSKFDDCLKTIDFFKDLKSHRGNKWTHLQIHSTVSIYNVNLLPEIEKYFQINYPDFEFSHRILYWPEQLSIKNLPLDYKELLYPIIDKYDSKYIDVKTELHSEGQDLFDHFLNFHNKLNDLRQENFDGCNKLLQDYINSYHVKPLDSKVFFLKQMDILQ